MSAHGTHRANHAAARVIAPQSADDVAEVTVLGAGPAGAAAALVLARDRQVKVRVLERGEVVGGNAGSFQLEGIWCDYGSHRFHPVAEPRVLDEVKSLLGEDLLWRPRHGRILLRNRWIHFPLRPIDLLLRLPKAFSASLALDLMRKRLPRSPLEEENFATVLERGLGRTISESFYYPYVQKLWGVAPNELAVTLARRRVSGSSIGKIMRKVARQIPGVGSPTAGGFYYPRRGYGAIAQSLYRSAATHGAEFVFGAEITSIEREQDRVTAVVYLQNGRVRRLRVNCVWSTLPITMLVKMMAPPPPSEVLRSAGEIRFRGMILVYLVLEQAQFTEYDAHYFPELRVPISRLSEPKNYAGVEDPRDRTVLCAELPSDPGEPEWELSDQELGQRLCDWLGEVGLPVRAPVRKVLTRRLRYAYPVYDRAYEQHFRVMDEWLAGVDGLLTFGRQGLFAHDNTHHAMTMAFAAGECFRPPGGFDWQRWSRYRLEFESHVVED